MNVPFSGNMCGYVLVFCASFSSAVEPWLYAAGRRLAVSREGWDGGRNWSGCSRTMGPLLLGGVVELEDDAARKASLYGEEGKATRCCLRAAVRRHCWHIDNVLVRDAIAGKQSGC